MKLRNKKTDEICEAEAREDGIYIKANWSDEEKWFCYDLETLASGWEYYVEPQEPLIKDEKIRKALRAWAEANKIIEVCYDAVWNGFRLDAIRCNFDYDFEKHVGLVDACHYTIAELCGEEEE